MNEDGKMSTDLTLLCANAYYRDGCAVPFGDSGLVLRMSEDELLELKTFPQNYNAVK